MWFCNGPVSGPDAHGGARLDLLGRIGTCSGEQRSFYFFFFLSLYITGCMLCLH